MFSSFTLLCVLGVSLRLALFLFLRWKWDVRPLIPNGLSYCIVLLAMMPAWMQPVPLPVPMSLALGFVLPDLLLARS